MLKETSRAGYVKTTDSMRFPINLIGIVRALVFFYFPMKEYQQQSYMSSVVLIGGENAGKANVMFSVL